ncbi:VWA domain-containing protein [Phyllobacterium sp. NPDC097923]|uniref:vWA domain-containing protein n=1 Tax=Phyllobacterium sp. NPDC097923 TaxID=3364404 RepID=UPI003839D42A
MIADFHFLRPWWLTGIPAAMLFLWLAARQGDMRIKWRGMIVPELLDHLISGREHRGGIRPYHWMAMLIALSAIALSGPTWQKELPPFVQDAAALVVAIDLSRTMDAIDVTPSRLERAKLKIDDILALRPAARTAVIAYAGSAHLVLPLTEDASLIRTYVNSLVTPIMPVGGRNTAAALELAEKTLADEEASGTILLMTDGIDSGSLAAVQSKRRSGLVILGIGTAQGGPVKTADGSFANDANGNRIFAKLDIDALRELRNSETSVATYTADDSDVHWIAQHIRTHFEQRSDAGQTRWRDFGWWLTIPIALLAAFTFRRGGGIRWTGAILAFHMITSADTARAADNWFADAWLTRDQQGRLAYQRGAFPDAADTFADPAWKGASLYRARKFDEAINAFARENTPESWFNQGNCLMQLGKYDAAVAAYEKALAVRKDWIPAKGNLDVAERLAARKKKDESEEPRDPDDDPDQIQFDEKGKQGKEGEVDVAEQAADIWMKNIAVSPAQLLARKFALEAAQGAK